MKVSVRVGGELLPAITLEASEANQRSDGLGSVNEKAATRQKDLDDLEEGWRSEHSPVARPDEDAPACRLAGLSSDAGWECPRCTFVNTAGGRKCDMCEHWCPGVNHRRATGESHRHGAALAAAASAAGVGSRSDYVDCGITIPLGGSNDRPLVVTIDSSSVDDRPDDGDVDPSGKRKLVDTAVAAGAPTSGHRSDDGPDDEKAAEAAKGREHAGEIEARIGEGTRLLVRVGGRRLTNGSLDELGNGVGGAVAAWGGVGEKAIAGRGAPREENAPAGVIARGGISHRPIDVGAAAAMAVDEDDIPLKALEACRERDRILAAVPRRVREEFCDILWVPWKPDGVVSRRMVMPDAGRVFFPALVLSPFDVNDGDLRRGWIEAHDRRSWRTLVHYYGYEGSRGFDLLPKKGISREDCLSLEEGLRCGCDRPPELMRKIAEGRQLSVPEGKLLSAINILKTETKRKKSDRGGLEFFPDCNLRKNDGRLSLPPIRTSLEHRAGARYEQLKRTRLGRNKCGHCRECMKEDCGKCGMCKDKPRFGGHNVKKQRCERKGVCLSFQATAGRRPCTAVRKQKPKPSEMGGDCPVACSQPLGAHNTVGGLEESDYSKLSPVGAPQNSEVLFPGSDKDWWPSSVDVIFYFWDGANKGECVVEYARERWKGKRQKCLWRTKADYSDLNPIEGPADSEVLFPGDNEWFSSDKFVFYRWDGNERGKCVIEYVGQKKWMGIRKEGQWQRLGKGKRSSAPPERLGETQRPASVPAKKPSVSTKEGPSALEIPSGSGNLSSALRRAGFNSITLDIDHRQTPDLILSIEEFLERLHTTSVPPILDVTLDHIWCAPDCSTWSVASGSVYRTMKDIDGIKGSVGFNAAIKAKEDILRLIQICLLYKERNPDLIVVFENPDGYLKNHKQIMTIFKKKLNLEMVKFSFCRFGDSDKVSPQKNTLLWTNSKHIIMNFRAEGHDGNHCFTHLCSSIVSEIPCPHMSMDGRKHEARVQEVKGRCAAYPEHFCTVVSTLLRSEVFLLRSKRRRELT
mmetsp:Transcript_37344/g.111868  ORF Transcript_37344/g.111868 Transcript_37344/m.111868 type:complete len:1029 (-) Transcript_37344:22-3108(-)